MITDGKLYCDECHGSIPAPKWDWDYTAVRRSGKIVCGECAKIIDAHSLPEALAGRQLFFLVATVFFYCLLLSIPVAILVAVIAGAQRPLWTY